MFLPALPMRDWWTENASAGADDSEFDRFLDHVLGVSPQPNKCNGCRQAAVRSLYDGIVVSAVVTIIASARKRNHDQHYKKP